MNQKNAWPSFVMDCNSYGFASLGLRTSEDWIAYVRRAEKLHEEHPGTPTSRTDGTVLTFLLEAKASPLSLKNSENPEVSGAMPSFGYYLEHRAEPCLEAWAKAHGVDLRALVEASHEEDPADSALPSASA